MASACVALSIISSTIEEILSSSVLSESMSRWRCLLIARRRRGKSLARRGQKRLSNAGPEEGDLSLSSLSSGAYTATASRRDELRPTGYKVADQTAGEVKN